MARKAVVTFDMLKAALFDLKGALKSIGAAENWDLVKASAPVSLGSDEKPGMVLTVVGVAPKGFPKEFNTREDAYKTMKTWIGVIDLVKSLVETTEHASLVSEALSEPESDGSENAPEVMTTKEIKVAEATEPKRRRRVTPAA
jgi:hypothetical protein